MRKISEKELAPQRRRDAENFVVWDGEETLDHFLSPTTRCIRDNPVMLAFWPEVIRPLLTALAPTHIVEIGSESGKTTRLLLEWAQANHAHVHSIDPAPLFDPDAVKVEFPGCFECTRLPSLVALPSVRRFDIVLIDGDHNWWTVYNELSLIEMLARDAGQPQPLVLLHDVSWPYGRRDLYYAPDAIPAEHRHPYARLGMSPTSSRLVMKGGHNDRLCNAMEEGGPRNGVLTAVEDYLAATSVAFEWVVIPAVYGLGILLPKALAEANPVVAEKVRVWAPPEVQQFIHRLEVARIAMLTG